jgi:heme ABC exporter ATP-binding subunit CcmA
VLVASHLTRRFDDRIAVDDVSFEVAPGEIFALLGPNGAGKTTTLRMLAGLIQPSSGQVVVDGEAMQRSTASRLRSRIGFLTEAPGLWDRLEVRTNLRVYANLHGLPNPDRAVDEALERFGLADRGRETAAHLSKGLKQRVALARTLLRARPVLLLDEPFSALDAQSRSLMQLELMALWERTRKSVLYVTHQIQEAVLLGDRVVVMTRRPGRVLTVRPVDLPRPRDERTMLTPAFVRLVDECWQLVKKDAQEAFVDG